MVHLLHRLYGVDAPDFVTHMLCFMSKSVSVLRVDTISANQHLTYIASVTILAPLHLGGENQKSWGNLQSPVSP